MLNYLINRILLAILTLTVILLVSYFLVRLAPGDPTRSMILGDQSMADEMSAEKGALSGNVSLRKKLHLDEPIIFGFLYWLKGVILHGDLGESASVDKGMPVAKLISERLPVTLRINICAILVTYLLAIPIGIYSAINPRSRFDKGLTFLLFFLYSLPTFWVALVLQATICKGGWLSQTFLAREGWMLIFPLKGISPGTTWGMSSWAILLETAKYYILPVFCLSYAGFAGLSRYAKTGMIEVIKQDYIRTARAKGLPEYVIIFKHALRNTMIILITLFAGLLPGLISGSIIIEYVFNIPGMGSLSMMALNSRDIPLLMALFGFGGGLTLAGILISDCLYVLVDPRITFAKKNQ